MVNPRRLKGTTSVKFGRVKERVRRSPLGAEQALEMSEAGEGLQKYTLDGVCSSHVGDAGLGELGVESLELGEAELRSGHSVELGELVNDLDGFGVAPARQEELGRLEKGEDDKAGEEDEEGDGTAD